MAFSITNLGLDLQQNSLSMTIQDGPRFVNIGTSFSVPNNATEHSLKQHALHHAVKVMEEALHFLKSAAV